MFEIKGGVISITRGDYGAIVCDLKDGDGDDYTMQEGDALTLTVRETPSADSPVLLAVSSLTSRLVITPEDTEGLEIGAFSADVQLTMADGKRFTFWPKLESINRTKEKNFKNFIIAPEVTRT